MITLTEASAEMKKPSAKRRRVLRDGEPAHLVTVGVLIGIVLESELAQNRENPVYTPKFAIAKPEDLEWEDAA